MDRMTSTVTAKASAVTSPGSCSTRARWCETCTDNRVKDYIVDVVFARASRARRA